jgi:hypothetical protein
MEYLSLEKHYTKQQIKLIEKYFIFCERLSIRNENNFLHGFNIWISEGAPEGAKKFIDEAQDYYSNLEPKKKNSFCHGFAWALHKMCGLDVGGSHFLRGKDKGEVRINGDYSHELTIIARKNGRNIETADVRKMFSNSDHEQEIKENRLLGKGGITALTDFFEFMYMEK